MKLLNSLLVQTLLDIIKLMDRDGARRPDEKFIRKTIRNTLRFLKTKEHG
jgi:hypothetical protein